ncbi:unnamed protein product, partial [Polarella glacialis]
MSDCCRVKPIRKTATSSSYCAVAQPANPVRRNKHKHIASTSPQRENNTSNELTAASIKLSLPDQNCHRIICNNDNTELSQAPSPTPSLTPPATKIAPPPPP